jgi:hypothetical protein
MRWKNWIIVIAAFAAVAGLADVVITRGILLRMPLSDSSRIQHLYLDNSDDMPIFGTSKAHGNYSPADMGVPAFNYGMDGVSYEVTDVLLQIELAKRRTTPIILELQYEDTGSLGNEERYLPFAYDARIRGLLERFHAMSWRYFVPGIRYFGYYDSALQLYFNGRLGVQKVTQGFSELGHPPPFDRAKLDEYIRGRLKARNGYFQDENQNSRLTAHITEHPERLFFLVISPYHPSCFQHFQNQDKLDAFEKKLQALPNVALIDWGHKSYPEEYFLDTLHLRRPAAAIFSRELGEKIREVLRERNRHAALVKS